MKVTTKPKPVWQGRKPTPSSKSVIKVIAKKQGKGKGPFNAANR